MTADAMIDTAFDVRTDSRGRDPDSHSKTLRRYHRLLWSKPLPGGDAFELDGAAAPRVRSRRFLVQQRQHPAHLLGLVRPARLAAVVATIPAYDMAAFYALGCTVGAFTVFPLKTRAGEKRVQTINQRRGTHPPT